MRTIIKKAKVSKVNVRVYNDNAGEVQTLETTVIEGIKNPMLPEGCTALDAPVIEETKEVTYELSPEKFFEVATIRED